MGKPLQRRPSRLRRLFRWCRIAVLTLLLVVVIGGTYVTTIGLPEFLKGPLLAKLRAEGVELDFQRIRWLWYRGIVTDQAAFTWLKDPNQPKFSSTETELDLDLRTLFENRLRLNSITIRNGQLIWPVSKTNDLHLALSNLTARIEFPSSRTLDLVQLEGDFAGTHLKFSGVITNFTGIQAWKIFRPLKDKPRKENLVDLAALLKQIHLTGEPELAVTISGDATEPRTMRGSGKFISHRAETPWGIAKNLLVTFDLHALLSGSEQTVVRAKADSLENTPWGSANALTSVVKLSPGLAGTSLFRTELRLTGAGLHTELATAKAFQFVGSGSMSITNPVPSSIQGKTLFTFAQTKWGKADAAEISFTVATNTEPKHANADWGLWSHAEPFHFNWNSWLTNVTTPDLTLERLSSSGTWRAPSLTISNLDGRLYGGGIQATAQLDVVTREVSAAISSDFDLKKIPLLHSTNTPPWTQEITWETPPRIHANLTTRLPEWTNSTPDWEAEVLPSLGLRGNTSVEHVAVRQIPFLAAASDFSYSNQVWTIPNLQIDRSEGGAALSLVANEQSGEFHALIRSQLDPKLIAPFLTETQKLFLNEFQFPSPPLLRADIQGRWKEIEKGSASGDVSIAEFSYQTNTVEKLSLALVWTNQQLRVSELLVQHAGKKIIADAVVVDLPSKKVYFTNVFSTVDPYLVTRLIGEEVAEAVEPYQFEERPEVHLNGSLTIGRIEDADLHFDVTGTRFRWKQFYADRISGRVDWVGMTLVVTNVQAEIYRGRAIGWSHFTFIRHHGADFRFDVAAADIDLQTAVSNLTGRTNRLEGILHGHWAHDSGNTEDEKTWRGHGTVNVRDGLLWDIPLFGLFSPILNAIIPGVGNSRAHEASAQFIVKNGLVYSDNLEIRSPVLRMQYRGAIDFDHHVDARVEAELLRDTWVIGRLISLVLTPLTKLFEYRVTGTLDEPESEPVYIPNVLMMTLRPFHSIKKALSPDKPAPASTNSTPATIR